MLVLDICDQPQQNQAINLSEHNEFEKIDILKILQYSRAKYVLTSVWNIKS